MSESLCVSVCMANGPSTRLRPAVITIDQQIPETDHANDPNWEAKAAEFFQSQANMIVDALQIALPGGTLDRVQAELCRRRSVLWHVPVNH